MNKKREKKIIFIHCGCLTLILGAVIGLIFLIHPGCIYGAQTDWSNQHFAIPEYFRTRFYATGNWFPNFAMHLGGGQNIFNFAYYGLYSPILLLSYAFPGISMATYIQISSILLTLLSSILCYFWLNKWFRRNTAFLLAILYLLASPVIFHSHHHIMFVSYFPFLFWGLFAVHRALEKRCSIQLILAAVCILLTSFFFSVGAFFTLFLYALFLTIHQHQVHVLRQILRTFGIITAHLLLAAVIAAFFLLPVAMTLFNGRDTDSSTSLWQILLPSIHLRYLTYNPFSIGMTSICILAIAAMLCFPKRSYRFLAIVFTVFFCFPAILYGMNGTMYLDPKAYIPFLPLLLLLCGFFFTELRAHQIARKQTLILFAVFLGLGLLMHDGTDYERIGTILDGMCMLIAFFLYTRKQRQLFILIPTLVFSITACLAVNLGDTYMKKQDLDVVYSDEMQELVDTIAEDDPSFYRISNEYHAGDTVNRIWGSNYYRSSVYSSIHNKSLSDFYFEQICNENSIRNAAMIVQSKNPIFGILMGEKYIITQKPINRYGMKQIAQKGAYLLYENTLAYPIGFATPYVMTQETLQSLGYPNQLEAFLENAAVSESDLSDTPCMRSKLPNSIKKVSPTYHTEGIDPAQITDVGEGYYIHSKEAFSITVTLDTPIDAMILLQFHVNNHLGNGSTTGDVTISVNGIRNKLTDPSWKYQNRNNDFQYTLSSDNPIQKLTLEFSAGDYVISDFAMYTMDYDILEQAAEQTDPWELKHDTLGDDTMEGRIQVKEDGWFVLSIPYDTGFQVFIDGVKTAYYPTNTDFIGCPISAGSHQIQITYTAPGFSIGKKVSVIGIAVTLLWFLGNLTVSYLHRRSRKKIADKLDSSEKCAITTKEQIPCLQKR
ncbi:YfhO family protein [Ruminococcus sp.]|uniref:YfhO family protein n=1 Tax=Ruminococcus sp. TaxID=41978 RepID=UPI0025F31253|nr:YfhO family protein [Ruminococcus sp.]